MSEEALALKSEVQGAVIKAVGKLGPDGLNRADIVRRFAGRGMCEATLYRWVASIIASGIPGRHVTRKVRQAAARRAKRPPDPAKVAAEVAEAVPVTRVEELVAGARSTVDVVEKLGCCIKIAERLIAHAETPEGGVRNSKLMLNASEHLRKSLETCVRLHEAIQNVSKVDAFIEDLVQTIDAVAIEFPAAGELIVRRTLALTARWEASMGQITKRARMH